MNPPSVPPFTKSSPAPGKIRFEPPWPLTLSSPRPAKTTSKPPPAQIRSLPPREWIVSSPPLETITSRPLVPVRSSLPLVPTIVGFLSKHLGWAAPAGGTNAPTNAVVKTLNAVNAISLGGSARLLIVLPNLRPVIETTVAESRGRANRANPLSGEGFSPYQPERVGATIPR